MWQSWSPAPFIAKFKLSLALDVKAICSGFFILKNSAIFTLMLYISLSILTAFLYPLLPGLPLNSKTASLIFSLTISGFGCEVAELSK